MIGVLREFTRFLIVVSNLVLILFRIVDELASSGLIGSSIIIAPPKFNPSTSGKNSSNKSSSFSSSSTKPAPNPVTCPLEEVAYKPPPSVVYHFFFTSIS